MKKIEINPMTRLEGHGKITIFLNDNGEVEAAFFQVMEFMGYEKFLIGMPLEEVPRTVSTICGVCRGVHFTASLKAADEIYGVKPNETARKIREIFYYSHLIEDHMEIIYALGLPDFVCGPTAPPAERNLIGLIKKVGVDVGKQVLKWRFAAVRIFEILGGKPSHPVAAIPGGWSKKVTKEEYEEMQKYADECVELGKFTLKALKDLVLSNPEYVELMKGDVYKVVTNYLGTVDEKNRVTYYDGTQRVVDTKGNEMYRFKGKEYLDYIAERTLEWSYVKAPYLKKLGWKGFIDGEGTSLYSVGPLARFNVGEGFDTPIAQEAYEEMVEFFGGKPVHNTLGYHWARAIELMHCAEKMKELLSDDSIVDSEVIQELDGVKNEEGVGIIEAARGTLIHHYKVDEKGIVRDVNLIVATTQNKGSINIAVRRAAEYFLKQGKLDEGILNMIEIAYRPYDLCLACAAHTLPGRLPIELEVRNTKGEVLGKIRNFEK
ncbi:MAG: Ni/Fe hydrogenase subunit alpha [Thermodesulfobacteria bacterium]|nr:Ni/Fe hydrogenase subunit alpha [Thermodesulfobacteriota bacterium]